MLFLYGPKAILTNLERKRTKLYEYQLNDTKLNLIGRSNYLIKAYVLTILITIII